MLYIVRFDLAIFFRMKNSNCVMCFFFFLEQMSLFYNAKLL